MCIDVYIYNVHRSVYIYNERNVLTINSKSSRPENQAAAQSICGFGLILIFATLLDQVNQRLS